MAVPKMLERSNPPQRFDAGLLVGWPRGDRVVEAELSAGDV